MAAFFEPDLVVADFAEPNFDEPGFVEPDFWGPGVAVPGVGFADPALGGGGWRETRSDDAELGPGEGGWPEFGLGFMGAFPFRGRGRRQATAGSGGASGEGFGHFVSGDLGHRLPTSAQTDDR